MSIHRIEYLDHDRIVAFDDELDPAFALYVLCRSYLAYGGKITSYSETRLTAEVTFLRPEQMVFTADCQNMKALYRAAQAIETINQPEQRIEDSPNGLIFALTGLAQAHSGEKTAMIALLAGANITSPTEVKAMTDLGLELALTVFMIDAHSGDEDRLPLLESIALVKIISDFLGLEDRFCRQNASNVMDATNYAVSAIPLLVLPNGWKAWRGVSLSVTLSDTRS
jgi:hypothetical protein